MAEKLTEVSSDRLVLTRSDGRVIAPSEWRYRHTDPETSKVSAERCEQFRAKHEAWIFDALHFFGERGGTAKEIAAKIQMTDVQVNRRLSHMGGYEKGVKVRIGVIERTDVVRDGCLVWRVAK